MLEDTSIVVVDVHGRRCGLLAADVIELQRAVAQRPLPEAPEVVDGVVNVRGALVPVVDTRTRLGLPRRATRPSDVLVITRIRDLKVALRVDAVHGIVEVPEDAVVAPEQVAPGTRHVQGLVDAGGDVVVIHDLGRFLSWDEADALQAVLEREDQPGTRQAAVR